MATPKKKHLIELMIEAGVKWPEGAEYAAQDNRDLYVWFYSEKPKFAGVNKGKWTSDVNYENGRKCCIVDGEKLNEICRNWHQTIVTREQYAAAVAAIGGKTNQVRESEDVPASQPAAQLCSGVSGVMPSESIESLLAEIKAKREEHDALVAKAEALALEIASIEQQVNDKLKEYGFAMLPLAASSELVDKPWEIGDKCIVTDSPDGQSWIGLECVLISIDRNDSKLPYLVSNQEEGDYWVRDIRRP